MMTSDQCVDSINGSAVNAGVYAQTWINGWRSQSRPDARQEDINPLCEQPLTELDSPQSSEHDSEFDWSLSNTTSVTAPSPPTASAKDLLWHGEIEDALFLYYFDHVFYSYCPFYFPSTRQGRGWLFSVLKRVKSAYHAALVLSDYHRSGSIRQRNEHYDVALQELQISLARSSAWSGSLGVAYNIELLTTMIHLLFSEVSVPSLCVISLLTTIK